MLNTKLAAANFEIETHLSSLQQYCYNNPKRSMKIKLHRNKKDKKIFVSINDWIKDITPAGELFDKEIDKEIYICDVPKDVLIGLNIKELPEDLELWISDIIDEDIDSKQPPSSPLMEIKRRRDDIYIQINDWAIKESWDWDQNISHNVYMQTKKEILRSRESEICDIKYLGCETDKTLESTVLTYCYTREFHEFDELFKYTEQLFWEVEGLLAIELESPLKNLNKLENEKDFTMKVLIPLIRKLGFFDVRYNHGKREFGKDVIFSRKTELNEIEYWGLQAKFGDISGKANSEIDTIISQIDDAFSIAFEDIYSKRKQWLSKLVIAISGKFTENAQRKILEKIPNAAARNNVVFLDQHRLLTLIDRFAIK